MSVTAELPVPSPESDPVPTLRRRLDLWRPWGGIAVALAPAAITLYLAFRGGGYHAETYAGVVAILAAVAGVTAIVAKDPFTGWSRPLAVAGAALCLLFAWTWLSGTWSDAPWRALFDSQRTAVYLAALVVFGVLGRRHARVQTAICALAAAIVAVCLAALLTRLFPDTFTASMPYGPQRLAFPLGYWNSLGLLAAVGVVLLLHLASDLSARPAVRATAAAGIPAAAATIYFTFSRGATGAVVLGVAAYLIVGRPRGLLSAALATVPATVLAVGSAYAAELLGTYQAASPAAATQRHVVTVALVVACALAAGIRLALLPLDRRLESMPGPTPQLRRRLLIGAIAAVLIGAAVAVVADAPARVESAYRSFTKPEIAADARTRFQEVTLSGRQQHWDVALRYFRSHPLSGEGGGTFETQWFRSRPNGATGTHAHSLYLEMLSELGLVGLALLVAALVALLGGLLSRARAGARPMYAALYAALLMWAVHAGVDYDWELPAVGFGLFAVTGLALARPETSSRGYDRRHRAWAFRALAAAACVVVFVTAVRIVIADTAINKADDDIVQRADCDGASAKAHTALSAVASHPKAYEILAVCDLSKGRYPEATTAMRNAISRDPSQWQYRYGLAIARAAVGRDPRPDLRRARRLNPYAESFAVGVGAELSRSLGPAGWRRAVDTITWPPH